jgi:hypothetical protein
MSNKQNVVIRGKLSFCKLLDHQLSLNYNKDGKEWKTDIQIDKDTVKELKGYGIADRVKMKTEYLDGAPFLSFKQTEFRKDGVTRNKSVPVVDVTGKPWPQDEDHELGNGTVADLRFEVIDFGPGKKKGVYIRGVRVLDHVKYERQAFAPLSEDDEYFRAAVEKEDEIKEFQKDFGLSEDALDDEIPL